MLETPDLSQSYNPQPKIFKSKKEPKPLKKIGKRTQAWLEGQPRLKVLFKKNGLTSCEIQLKGCKKNYLLGFAHITRRGNYDIDTLADPHVVVLACQFCHTIVDDASQMEKIKAELLLKAIVASRGW